MNESAATATSPTQLLIGCTAALLAAIGVCFIYSAGYVGAEFPVRANWLRQIVFLGCGCVAAWFLTRLDNRRRTWRWMVFAGYAVSLTLLLAVFLCGRSIGGARRWLQLGGWLLQPAEFAKLFTILAGALFFSGDVFKGRLKSALAGSAAFVVPAALIAAEPSYGNALALLAPLAVLLATRLLPAWCWGLLLALALTTAGGATCALEYVRSHPEALSIEEENVTGETGFMASLFRGYHLKRFKSYLSAKGGWNERQAILTIAGGGAYGKGYLNGTMNKLGYLPRTVAPTDFIFAVLAEESGFFFGVMPVLALYAILYALLLHQAAHAEARLDFNLIAAGTTLMATHTIVGVAMNIRLLPVIGLPMPLLSYGGSFTVATVALIGIMAAARHHGANGEKTPGSAHGIDILRIIRINLRIR